MDFCSEPVDRVVTTIGFQPATQKKHQQVLKLRPSSVVAVIDITYYSGDTPAGFAMVYMPHEVLDNSNVDLRTRIPFTVTIRNCWKQAGCTAIPKSAWDRPGNVWPIYLHPGRGPALLLEEVLYTEYDTPVLSQKLFFGPDQHELSIRRKNDRNMMKKSE